MDNNSPYNYIVTITYGMKLNVDKLIVRMCYN